MVTPSWRTIVPKVQRSMVCTLSCRLLKQRTREGTRMNFLPRRRINPNEYPNVIIAFGAIGFTSDHVSFSRVDVTSSEAQASEGPLKIIRGSSSDAPLNSPLNWRKTRKDITPEFCALRQALRAGLRDSQTIFVQRRHD